MTGTNSGVRQGRASQTRLHFYAVESMNGQDRRIWTATDWAAQLSSATPMMLKPAST